MNHLKLFNWCCHAKKQLDPNDTESNYHHERCVTESVALLNIQVGHLKLATILHQLENQSLMSVLKVKIQSNLYRVRRKYWYDFQRGVALNKGMPHPPNFEGCIIKVFFIHFQNFEFLSSI